MAQIRSVRIETGAIVARTDFTFVHIFIAQSSFVAGVTAFAREVVVSVDADSAIKTRTRFAFVEVVFAIFPGKTGFASA